MPSDPLAELLSSAERPLRFLLEADPVRRARTSLPVRAWLAQVERLRAATRAAGGGERGESLAALAGALAGLEDAGEAGRAVLARRALDLIDVLRGRAGAAAEPGHAATPAVERGRAAAAAPAAGPGPALEVGPPGAGREQVEAYLGAIAAPTSTLPGVGPARAKELARFGLGTLEDVLYHLPFRYEDRRNLRTTRELHAGETATVSLVLERVDERRVGRTRRSLLSALARDAHGRIELVWYHQLRYFRSRLKPGSAWLVHGRVERGYDVPLRIVHPELEPASESDEGASAPRIQPVYEKPTAMPVSTMRRICRSAVEACAGLVPDVLPPEVRDRYGLLPLGRALRGVHEPAADADASALGGARSPEHLSIVFDELFFVQLGLLLRKAAVAREAGIAFAGSGELARRLVASLPFALTGAQRRVIAEIEGDMRAPHPMHRLVQGDVGSGKTVVAVAAALHAIEAGYQAVLMAPTELLAEQHWETVRRVAGGLDVGLWYLTGAATAAERRLLLERMAAGEPGLAVGTHALIQEGVRFARLGLAIIDEQHRFGVMQRAALSRGDVGRAPDVLLMTATPIPRTLALSVYGDLDLSFIDELPPGRKPVTTRIFGMAQRRRAYDLVRREVDAGRQAYVVYPLIEESEKSDLRDATSAADELARDVFPDRRLALIHGRMPGDEREAVMRAFKAGEFAILVATTVIEVGIDVPNASVIVIEHAERFGLAQLHQLRGRVGRGSDASYCLLVADYAQSQEAKQRLQVMSETRDGLRIAEADLEIRGPGALLGTRQAGMPDFRVANLLRDVAILREARVAAEAVLARDPTLGRPEWAPLARVLEARWAGRLGLARVG